MTTYSPVTDLFVGRDFSGFNLSGISWTQGPPHWSFVGTSFSNCAHIWSFFGYNDFTDANLTHTLFYGSHFDYCTFTRTKFQYAALACEMTGNTFTDCDFEQADFTTMYGGANTFTGGSYLNVTFNGVTFAAGTKFTNCNFQSTNMLGTDWTGVTFTNCTWTDPRYDGLTQFTVWPFPHI